MENAKISQVQFFILLVLFEVGTSLVIPFGMEAGKDVWLAIFLGAVFGCILFIMYYQLYLLYPDDVLTSFVRKILGNWIGIPVSFMYIVVAFYISARVLRDFGELLRAFSYRETPICVINTLLMLLVIYGVNKGIETISRTAELNFMLVILVAVFGLILIFLTDQMTLDRIRPVLENGWSPVFRAVFTETLYVPYGEVLVFTFLFPYLNNNKRAKMLGITGLLISGIALSGSMLINLLVLGFHIVEDSPFPLFTTVQMISVADFLERLDIIFLIVLFIGTYFKLSLYFYAGIIGLADLFKLKSHKEVTFPLGIIIIYCSLTIASSYSEFIMKGKGVSIKFFVFPAEVIVPIILLVVAYIKRKKRGKNNGAGRENQQNQKKSSPDQST